MEIIVYVALGIILGVFLLAYLDVLMLVGAVSCVALLLLALVLYVDSNLGILVFIGIGLFLLLWHFSSEKVDEYRNSLLKEQKIKELIPPGILWSISDESTLHDLDVFFKDHAFQIRIQFKSGWITINGAQTRSLANLKLERLRKAIIENKISKTVTLIQLKDTQNNDILRTYAN